MKLSKIVDTIKKRFTKIVANPYGHTLSIGDTSLDIVGFDFTMDSCNFCNDYCNYIGSMNSDATIRVQGRMTKEAADLLELLFNDVHDGTYQQRMVLKSNSDYADSIVLENAFVRSYKVSYENMRTDIILYDMEIVASSYRVL